MYVGYSVNPEERFKKGHCKNKKWPINKAIKKHGEHNFKIIILFDTFSKQEIGDIERYYIKEFNTLAKNGFGYNVHEGGEGGNTFAGMSEEERAEIKRKEIETKTNRPEELKAKASKNMSEGHKNRSLEEKAKKSKLLSEARSNKTQEQRDSYKRKQIEARAYKYTEEENGFIFSTFNQERKNWKETTKLFNQKFNKNIGKKAIMKHIKRIIFS